VENSHETRDIRMYFLCIGVVFFIFSGTVCSRHQRISSSI